MARYQYRHGLSTDSIIGPATLALVGVTVAAWARPGSVWLLDRLLLTVVVASAVIYAAVLVHFRMLPPVA